MYALFHELLLSSYTTLFNLHTWVYLSCVSTPTGYKCLFIVYAFLLWEASCYESCLVSHNVDIYCMLDLVDWYSPSLSSWLLLHSWKALHQWCRSTMSHNCIVFETSFFAWKYRHIILHLGLFLKQSSLTCSSKQVSSFFSCRWLYTIFPISQMHQLYRQKHFIMHIYNGKFLCIKI